MSAVNELIEAVEEMMGNTVGSMGQCDCISLQLLSINPLQMQKTRELILDSNHIILPPNCHFSEKDIGKIFQFIATPDGQRYYLFYDIGGGNQ